MVDYGREFDKQVSDYNRWFESTTRKSLEQSQWLLLAKEFFFGTDDSPSPSLGTIFKFYIVFMNGMILLHDRKRRLR